MFTPHTNFYDALDGAYYRVTPLLHCLKGIAMAKITPQAWQVAPILVGASLFNRKLLRPDRFIKLVRAAIYTAWTVRSGEAWVIGAVEKHYGAFRLHAFSLQLKDGTLRQQPFLMVIIGALPSPVIIPLWQTYSAWESFDQLYGAVLLGNIRRAHSESCDVYRYVRQWQETQDAQRAQREKPFAPKALDRLPPETQERMRAQAETRIREENARAEARKPVVKAALGEFETLWQCEDK